MHAVLAGVLLHTATAYPASFDETVAALRPIAQKPVSKDYAKGQVVRVAIDKIIAKWDGLKTDEGIHQVLGSLDSTEISIKMMSWMFQNHLADEKKKGDLLAYHLLRPRDEEQRRLLNFFGNPERAEASLALRSALITELDDEVKVNLPGSLDADAWPTNSLAYNLLISYVETHGFIHERNIMSLSPGSGMDGKREWIAKLRVVIANHPEHFVSKSSP